MIVYAILLEYNWDIMGFQEPNHNWDLVQPMDQWEKRVLGCWKNWHTTIKAHNTTNPVSSISQPWGCMVTTVNKAKRKVTKCGVDWRGLGC